MVQREANPWYAAKVGVESTWSDPDLRRRLRLPNEMARPKLLHGRSPTPGHRCGRRCGTYARRARNCDTGYGRDKVHAGSIAHPRRRMILAGRDRSLEDGWIRKRGLTLDRRIRIDVRASERRGVAWLATRLAPIS